MHRVRVLLAALLLLIPALVPAQTRISSPGGIGGGGGGGGVTSLTGTANQVNVSAATGAVTLSTPQNIGTASTPTFGSLTLSGLTQGSVLFAGAGGAVAQDNANLFWDDANNRFGINIAAVPTATFHLVPATAGTVGQVIRAAAGQTANLFEVRNSADVQMFRINNTADLIQYVGGQFSNITTFAFDASYYLAAGNAASSNNQAAIWGLGVSTQIGNGSQPVNYRGVHIGPSTTGGNTQADVVTGLYINFSGITNVNSVQRGIEVVAARSKFGGAALTFGTAIASQVYIQADTAATIGQIVKGAVSQTADLAQYQDSAGAVLGAVKAGGGVLSRSFRSSKTANYPVVAADSGTHFDNIGAAGTVVFTLPTAVAGFKTAYCVQAAQILQVTAPASTTIALGASISAAAGNIQASAPYACAEVEAISTTEYVGTSVTGSWTVN